MPIGVLRIARFRSFRGHGGETTSALTAPYRILISPTYAANDDDNSWTVFNGHHVQHPPISEQCRTHHLNEEE